MHLSQYQLHTYMYMCMCIFEISLLICWQSHTFICVLILQRDTLTIRQHEWHVRVYIQYIWMYVYLLVHIHTALVIALITNFSFHNLFTVSHSFDLSTHFMQAHTQKIAAHTHSHTYMNKKIYNIFCCIFAYKKGK